ncbi:TIR domain-containing protein [Pectobacterium versatile]|uniref:TIR domain-containing protein n=1 Tax=Pectobacterium versatile TaxID=2488639 RepID=UPI001CCAD40F|nr:TIR domain-containing protein [Pectobacterium versatile]
MQTVFYSWQSDISSKTNRNVIEKSITVAIKKVNSTSESKESHFTLDKDTLNESGSPDIVDTIMRKIDRCSFFIADITPILTSSTGKNMPNSNVLFESGYSVGKKGFNRTFFIVNEAYAAVETLPFDLKTKRILKYNLSESDLSDPENKDNIVKVLTSAIAKNLELINTLPETELSVNKPPTKEIKRNRDLMKLKRFLEQMPSKIIQEHINYGIDMMIMNFNTFTALYNMQSIQSFIGFRLYDLKLQEHINLLMENFEKSLSFGLNFHHFRDDIYKFKANEVTSESDYIIALKKLNYSLDNLLNYIHSKYIEIDLEEYGDLALKSYYKEIKENED